MTITNYELNARLFHLRASREAFCVVNFLSTQPGEFTENEIAKFLYEFGGVIFNNESLSDILDNLVDNGLVLPIIQGEYKAYNIA